MLVVMGFDVNVRRYNNIFVQGVSALYFVVRCGVLDSFVCLVTYKVDVMMFDSQGWVFVYYVVFFNYVDCFMYLIYCEFKLLEFKFKDDLEFISIFLVFLSGVFDLVKCLIEFGAQYIFIDKEGNGVVYFVVFYFYINILEYFISWNNDEVLVWDLFVGMLKFVDDKRKYSVVKCFEVLFLVLENNWKFILYVGGVFVFVDFFRFENVEF